MGNLFVSGSGVRAIGSLKNSPSGNPKFENVTVYFHYTKSGALIVDGVKFYD